MVCLLDIKFNKKCFCEHNTHKCGFRNSLQFYRGKKYDITDEFDEILKQNCLKTLKAKTSSGWRSTLRRIASPAFGQPFKCVGILFILVHWGEFNNLLINMIHIFRESKSTIEPRLAPVFVGCIQVKIVISFTVYINLLVQTFNLVGPIMRLYFGMC